MMDPVLARHEEPLREATVVSRPNRFVLEISIDGTTDRAYLADPGELAFLDSDATVLCSPVDGASRSTNWDAVAAAVDGGYVSLKAALANDLFLAAFRDGFLDVFAGYRYRDSEPNYPVRGRADFLLVPPDGENDVYVEVKSCTHQEDGMGKFPDRPTKRGRRHLRSLEAVVRGGHEAHVFFVAQHPGIEEIVPYRDVDPEFADLLSDVTDSGVEVHAMATEFTPPAYRLRHQNIPVSVR